MKLFLYLVSGFTLWMVFSCSDTMPTPVPYNPPVITAPVTSVPSSMPVTTPPQTQPAPTQSNHDGFTYLALGDSYTIGQSVMESDRWPVQLANMFVSNGVKMNQPDIIARTGWTTAELAEGIKASGNTKKYDMVSILIGVNNQYRGQSPDVYRTELASLLVTATAFAGNMAVNVFMLSIPDWGVTPYAINSGRDVAQISREINQFNVVAQEECKKKGIVFIDITTISKTARNDISYLASDQLHFSGKMYTLWASKAYPNAQAIIGN